MTFADVTIPGVVAPVSTRGSFFSGLQFFVAGERVKPHGFPRNKLSLPGTHGPVEAKVKAGLFRAYPAFVVGDAEYPTGPRTPAGLQVLALLPLLGLVIIQGIFGFLIAFGGLLANMAIIRTDQSKGAKVGLMVGVLLAVLAIEAALAVALTTLLY